MLGRTFAEVTLTAATAETTVMVKASSGHQVRVREFGASFRDGGASDQAVLVELARATTDGTASAGTIQKLDDDSDTFAAAATKTFTAEPTIGDILYESFVSPAPGGGLIWTPPEKIVVPGDGRIVVRLTTQAGVTPVSRSYIIFEE